MDETTMQKAMLELEQKKIQFGTVSVILTFHDGKITKWNLVTSESHNVYHTKNRKETENENATL